ncbi:MAG TPA: DUF2272 domain-containing protein [Pseudoxanthomonas sp.]|nr:DUF2272 domain-containing protein [Pseudoxanthomonas sp.]
MRAWKPILVLWMLPLFAWAADHCPRLRTQTAAADPATRIAALACSEHALWFRPFIDRNGRMASSAVSEAEARPLEDGQSRAWQRVARYWQETGLLGQVAQLPGAQECAAPPDLGMTAAACRGFVIDNAWSAAFVSWVMRQAALPGFRASASHIGYVRDAYLRPDASAYRFTDPASTKPAAGDMLCYVRHGGRAYGHDGLRAAAAGGGGLDMHCEVIVAVDPDNDSTAYLIGGNVQQSVTMRLLPLNRNGQFWNLPYRGGGESTCSPDNEAACNFNRQDWAVLLQLKPADELSRLPGAPPPSPLTAPSPTCCVNCVVGSGVPRCPAPETP